MKTAKILIALALWIISPLSAQNITNKLGDGGVFTIKDASTDFVTLKQSNGYLGIGTTTPNNLLQVANLINFDTPLQSTALGVQALLSNTGDHNTGVGAYALLANTSGLENTAAGARAMYSNISGSFNTAFGTYALRDNLENYNTG